MGVIINIDEALKLRAEYNILREPLNEMLRQEQEAWEKKNPIDLLFVRNSIATFQETYVSSIGFDHAFAETSDYAIGPIFNTANGFSATYRTRTFQGSFIITQQTLEDRQLGRAKDDASEFIRRWHGDTVEYAMAAISSGFGVEVQYGSAANGGVSRLKLTSADTSDGDTESTTKNPLFYKNHTIVKREGMTAADVSAAYQSNLFYAAIDIKGDDPSRIAKLADVINQVITTMENYKNDNGKRVVSMGEKTIVAPNDATLLAALNTAIDLPMLNEFGSKQGTNPAYKRAKIETTPYLLDIPQCANGRGFFIVDKAYNAANHGPEFTERIALTLDVIDQKRPKGIIYDGRQRFDINVASWRGIAYVYLGTPAGAAGAWDVLENFTQVVPSATTVKPVSVVGTVTTQTAGG